MNFTSVNLLFSHNIFIPIFTLFTLLCQWSLLFLEIFAAGIFCFLFICTDLLIMFLFLYYLCTNDFQTTYEDLPVSSLMPRFSCVTFVICTDVILEIILLFKPCQTSFCRWWWWCNKGIAHHCSFQATSWLRLKYYRSQWGCILFIMV